ncbi:hypothetical protein SAMN02983003_3378 [Devosia enhydra]|uniref:Uncharacterized protein n=1 Tax=Devosia enhydra TaxID=665118 RepID=A0A1K2I1W0_9HYPH|nr:hypothetical protein [Devosia enhydra]SFZ86203.1 hypothetical protein SAMN02983003_3378 [Devosia enhydra]
MSRIAWPFILVALFTLALAALGYGLAIKGYGIGMTGVERLDAIAAPAMFMPLAALYAFSAALVALLPLRAASFTHASASVPLYSATLILLATIVGVVLARVILVDRDTIRQVLDWHLLFALAVIGVHLLTNQLRKNLLIRSLAVIALLAASGACLFWSFRL